jgi:hypothetical protein
VARAQLGDTQVSDEVLQLVRTVERLGPADQERILRIVKLLAVVPGRIQVTTKHMLRKVIDGNPSAVYDSVDEVIEYLEDNLLAEADTGDEEPCFYFPASPVRN